VVCAPVPEAARDRDVALMEPTVTPPPRWPPVRSPYLCEHGGSATLSVVRSGEEDYCSFAKAVEHLGDRWSLLIIADLAQFGPQGFNALAMGLPGRISRSVLADRLQRLESMGIVTRIDRRGRADPYQLTTFGRGLVPTIASLRDWAATWLPDDPKLAEQDPDFVLAWLTRGIDAERLPARRTVIEFRMRHQRETRCWLVLERDQSPYACFDDPLLDESRYVYVDASAPIMLALARGTLQWREALSDGSLTASGDPKLTGHLPEWFTAGVRSQSASAKD
jgi:DNA-binding HxlR family transcriptional regulator